MLRDDAQAGKLPLPPSRVSRHRLVRLAAVAGLLILALLLLRTLAQSHVRRTATNNLTALAPLVLAPGAKSCQTESLVPRGTATVAFAAQTAGPAGRVLVTVAGSTATGPTTGARTYPFLRLSSPLRADRRAVPVCFTNEGGAPLSLFGAPAPGGGPVQVRLDWFRAANQRNWTMGSTVASRFPLAKAPFLGPWAFWASVIAALALSAAALWWMLRGREA